MPVFYTDIVKGVDAKGELGKQLQRIAKQMEDSRSAGAKNPLEHIPKYVKLLNSCVKDLNGLKKDAKADKKNLKVIDELVKQVQSDIGRLAAFK
jgi:phage tail tape-measure protein